MNEKLWKYLRRDKKNVEGWLQRVDAEIIGSILSYQDQQNIQGSCVEIGVHHGKSFLPLCMALNTEDRALCIDIFDDQEKNLDASGTGDLSAFMNNLKTFGIDHSRVKILKTSSENVEPEQILEQVGRVRFFSVDGGHWKSIVHNDLLLAEGTLAPAGVIALDDYFRTEWPEVTHGYALWQAATTSDIVPFAVGSNKLYLCRKDHAPAYRAALRSPFLRYYFRKSYRTENGELDSYRVEPFKQDEESAARALVFSFGIFRPDLFIALRTWLRK
jgi:Methyltransferase domain